MRKAAALSVLFFLGSSATVQAQSLKKCLTTEVGGVATRLESLTIPIPNVTPKDKTPVRIEVRAVKAEGGEIVTPFECALQEKDVLCFQSDGAGDFLLTEKDGTVFFETEYLNFALGAISGLPPRKNSDPINEDYAILFEDSENEETHPDRISLKTTRIECPAPAKAKK
ncbi:MAG TPA: hypothetical protein PL182_03340 [Pseudobdellovibrionaceae bacterium]|nr:hypothetical protein [Pseudobdellovibrionaceae bacterium]